MVPPALCHKPWSCSLVTHLSAGLAQHLVLLYRHTAELLSKRFIDSGFRPFLRWSRSTVGDVILAAVEVTIPKNKSVHQLLGFLHFAICRGLLGFFAFSLMQFQRRLEISRPKNIESVVELSAAFLLAPPYGRLLVI